MQTKVYTIDNKESGQVDLKDSIFGLPIRVDILHRAVNWQRAKSQQGTHQTKEIWAISGTTKKPWKQKGTGRARQGSLRSPQFRGGAVIFGPVTRSHAHSLTKKFRKLALRTALSAKAAEGNIKILEQAKAKSGKIKDIKKSNILQGKSVLIIDADEMDNQFSKAVRNLANIDILPQKGANVMDILNHEQLVLTKDALTALEARLS